MALSKIDVANMLTGATPVANGGTALTSGFANGRTNNQMAPLIVNGDMAVAQRSDSTVAQADSSNEVLQLLIDLVYILVIQQEARSQHQETPQHQLDLDNQ